jgi:nitrite reductase (cytochrome c-552)
MNDTAYLRKRVLAFAAFVLAVALATAAVTALLINIFERKQEAKSTYVRVTEVGEDDVDPAKWGRNWPRQYDGYKRTAEPSRTKYGGGVGPEGTIPEQKAKKDPWLTRLFAGYLFAVDYRDRRGHAFMLHDQEVTKRNVREDGKQSGNCLHCHASIMPLYRAEGAKALPNGTRAEQIDRGLEVVGAMGYWDAYDRLKSTAGAHPVSCVDCHDPKSMELRVTRPGFIKGIRAFAASDKPAPHLPSIERWRKGGRGAPYDPNVDGMRQEMRSYVCAQCHVEYFCGKGTTIFFPWENGLKVEEIEQHYDQLEIPQGKRFKDWTHAETGMDVLKAQHPEFEVWSQGIHAKSGVACADCHMPYKREGALKVSEHWVRSPLLAVNRACQSCHPYPEDELKGRVETIQDRHYALLTRAGQAAVAMLDAINAVRKPYDERNHAAAAAQAQATLASDATLAGLDAAGQEKRRAAALQAALLALWQADVAKDPALKELGDLQRAAQWRLDFVAAENSMGFHAPQETSRILGESIDLSRTAQLKAVAILGGRIPLPGPETSPLVAMTTEGR